MGHPPPPYRVPKWILLSICYWCQTHRPWDRQDIDLHTLATALALHQQKFIPQRKVLPSIINTLRPRQIGRHFADDTFKRIFLNENVIILIQISLKFVPKGPINNIPVLVHIMAWRRLGDKPLSEAMMVSLLTHICILGLNELICGEGQ